MTRRLVSVLSAMVLIGTGFVASTTSTGADAAPAIQSFAAPGNDDLYIDESFQTVGWEEDWLAIGREGLAAPSVVKPSHGIGEGPGSWLQLTSDNTRGGNGESGFVLNENAFSSSKGVVIEYDQRIYRTNNGMHGTSGAGDGLSVFLVDGDIANSNTSKGSNVGTNIDQTTNEPGGFGAGLGYSSVAGPNQTWCGDGLSPGVNTQQQGVAGGWFGLGFDVFGNYGNSDWWDNRTWGSGRTRPHVVSGGIHKDTSEQGTTPARISTQQMVGLRGSGVRHSPAGTCTDVQNQHDLNYWYGKNRSDAPGEQATHGGYQWLDGNQSAGKLDNEYNKAATYRKVRIVLTPKDSDKVSLEVLMTDPLQVSNDEFLNGGWMSNPNTPPVFTSYINNEIGDAQMQADLPDTFKIGFAASTGYAVNYHQIRNLKVAAPVDLELKKTVSNGTPNVGDRITYTLNVANLGPTDLNSNFPATITDGLAGLPLEDVTWTATGNGGAQVRALGGEYGLTAMGTGRIKDEVPETEAGPPPFAGDLVWFGPTGSTVTVEITGTVTKPTLWDTDIENTAVVSASVKGGPQDQNPENDRDTAKIRIPAQPHLTITKDDSVTEVSVGQTTTYALDVENTGPAAALNAVVTDTLPQGLEYVSSTPAGATAVKNGDGTTTVTFPVVASIAAGGSLSEYTVTAKVVEGAPESLRNTVKIGADNDCDSSPLAERCEDEDINILESPEWLIAKTSDKEGEVLVGDTIEYSVTATNNGPGSVVGAVLTDDLSDVLNYANFVPGSVKVNEVSVSDAAPNADKKLISAPLDLASEQVATLTYQVTVISDAHGKKLKNVVTGVAVTTPPSTCADPETAGDEPGCWTEHPVTGQYYLNKVDGDDVMLGGAKFQVLTDDNGVPGSQVGSDITAGSAVLTGLTTGTYWLKETEAPSGYELLAQPVRFTVTTGGNPALVIVDDAGESVPDGPVTVLQNGLTIQVKDVASLILPDAGGSGTAVYTVIGVGILLSAAFILAQRARRPRPTVPAGNGGAVTR